jgi:hypothetical protein
MFWPLTLGAFVSTAYPSLLTVQAVRTEDLFKPNLLDLGNAAVRLTLDDVPQVALSLLLLLATGG